jgi:myo-inositol 2-dehydrogenase/D-chiro-inositol 1-dehydrogenase
VNAPQEPYRIGLIGSGHISRTYMAAMRQVPEGRVVAVWSRQRDHAVAFAECFDLEFGTDRVEDLCPAVDVVCVNSPNALHAEHAIAAARAGCHVIVEKPLAASLSQATRLVSECRDAGVGLAYAEELPFVPKFVRAREILQSGALGDPLYVTQREAHAGPYSPWFFTREEAGGGCLMDMGCHSVECVRWLLGKPAVLRVGAQIATLQHRQGTPLDDHAVLQLEFASGTRALCESSWVLSGGMQSKLEIWGSEGVLEVDLLQGTGMRLHLERSSSSLLAEGGWSDLMVDGVSENGYPQELSHFLRCFREGREPAESGEDGLRVLEILCAAYTSAREGRTVALPHTAPPHERVVDLWRPV